MLDLKAFQAANRNPYGEPLAVDGVLGPQTQWSLAIAQLGPQRQAIVNCALNYTGKVSELGDNRHPEIDRWLLRCGVPVGLAWCAAFASFCVSAASGLNLHEASVARLSKLLPECAEPIAGDLFFYLNADGTGHVGVVIGVSAGEVMTIEGNQRNAVRTLRRRRGGLKFLRTVALPGVLATAPLAVGGTR